MRQPTLLVLTHGKNARLGRAETPLVHGGLLLDVRNGDDLPRSVAGYAGLLVMGGAGSAFRDSEEFPTRVDELFLMQEALDLGMPVLGVCLGAQLLAHVAGGWGYDGILEQGWVPIQVSDAARRDDPLFRRLPEELVVMQNHSRHYTLPAGATALAYGELHSWQAFRVGESAWGLQFHPEADEQCRFPVGMENSDAFRRIATTTYAIFSRFAAIAFRYGANYLPPGAGA